MTLIYRILFLAAVLIFLTLLGLYAGMRCWQALSPPPAWKIPFTALVIVWVAALPLSMLFRDHLPPGISGTVQAMGGTALIVLLYAAIFFLFFDLLRWANHLLRLFPTGVAAHYVAAKRIAFALSTLLLITILWIGNWKFRHPVLELLHLQTVKSFGGEKKLNILFFSDLHLNGSTSARQLRRYVDLINDQQYDLVLIGGDFTDGDPATWVHQGFDKILQEIHPKYGTYVSLGNHEYYTGVEESLAFIRKAGCIPLRDEIRYTGPDSSVVIVGRDDRTNPERAKADDLLKEIDKDKYIIVLDHQPADLQGVARGSADLLLCGHTHNGQLFPLTSLIHWMWEVPYGYRRIGKTDLYVSSGLAAWGPKFRIGSQSEMVALRVDSAP